MDSLTSNRPDTREALQKRYGAEAILATTEQSPAEHYRIGQNVKAFVLEVRRSPRGPQIYVSRTHKGFLRRLFELEVPEIADGTVEIMAIAREAGHRTKMAVVSHKQGVAAKGSCIGPMGARVRNVVNELHGEKIDIVDYSDDPAEYVANALSPARVVSVEVVDRDAKQVRVVVPDYQLSLAIGKEGQNARLAARLTGWSLGFPDRHTARAAQISGASTVQLEQPLNAAASITPADIRRTRRNRWGREPSMRANTSDDSPLRINGVAGCREMADHNRASDG